MDKEHPAHAVRKPGYGAQEEIAAPADRLEDPEGAVLVVEERTVQTHAARERLCRRLDLRLVGRAPLRGCPSLQGRAVRRHYAGYRGGLKPKRACLCALARFVRRRSYFFAGGGSVFTTGVTPSISTALAAALPTGPLGSPPAARIQ